MDLTSRARGGIFVGMKLKYANMNSNPSEMRMNIQSYVPPVCEALSVGIQKVICASGDDNGEMYNGGFLDE